MSNKIKRNDPCPCGSGKKFKNCCLVKGDNPYAFPGHDATHGDIERYQRFVDNWDESQGQPPSFMQFLGRANAATEYLNDIQESIGTHDYQSIDELNEVFQAQVDKRNNTPVEDFLGLTPEQMYSLTRYDFKSNSDIVEFSEPISLSMEATNGTGANLLCVAAQDHPWIKKTAGGFRKRSRVREAILFHLGGLDLMPNCQISAT